MVVGVPVPVHPIHSESKGVILLTENYIKGLSHEINTDYLLSNEETVERENNWCYGTVKVKKHS
jgi:hypothetical protein